MKIINTCISVLALTSTLAQSVMNEGAILSIAQGTEMSISANLINKGTMINKGTILLDGNWVNVGNFSDEGTLFFIGSSDQVIAHNAQYFNNIQVSGSGKKIIADDLTINGSIDFQSGKLLVEEGVHFTLGQDITITGVNEGRYIIGRVFREGNGEFSFPIGSETEYLPVSLTVDTKEVQVIGMEVLSGQTPTEPGEGLEQIFDQNHWRIYTEDTYEGGSITLPYNNDGSTKDINKLVVAQTPSLETPFSSIGNVEINGDLSAGTITSNEQAIGPYFAIGFMSDNPIPPIKVINVVTPLQDGKHDFLRIENIELYKNNVVEIFDRNGKKVFSISGYDNQNRVFEGVANKGSQTTLSDGNYFYTIRDGRKHLVSGFLFLKN